MQSKVKSDFEIKTYYATWQEMGAFAKFVRRIEEECQDQCAAKIIPPSRFNAYSKEMNRDMVLSHVMIQRVDSIKIRNDIAYELSGSRQKMTYEQFIKKVKNYDLVGKSDETMEEMAWQKLEAGRLTSCYSVDNDISLFGDECKRMNLNKFTRAESLIHQGSLQLGGIHTPLTYIGSHITYYGLHLEDENLNSINYLHNGERKIWYFIPASENEKIEKLANDFGKKVHTTCNNFIRHKSLLIPPTVLRKNNIKFGRVVQRPNEFIISFSGGYHAGFNCGLNKAEAINFGTTRWLKFYPEFLTCQCVSNQAAFVRELRHTIAGIYEVESKKWQRENSFTCEICDKTFSSKHNIQLHMRAKHCKMVARYVCSSCNGQFTRRVDVNTHSEKTHGIIKNRIEKIMIRNPLFKGENKPKKGFTRQALTCEECGITVHGTFSLNRHMSLRHK